MTNDENLYKISVDVEDLAYKISRLEEAIAKLFAYIEDAKERE